MKPRVGILGYSTGGKAHYSELRRSDKFEVCGVFESDGVDEYCRAEIYTNFKIFIENAAPNAIVISLEEKDVFEAFCECVKYCKNILLCLPICKSMDELAQMKYLAHKNDVRVALCFSSRFNPTIFSLLKELKKEEEVYSIEIFHSTLGRDLNIVNELLLKDIDMAKIIAASDIVELNSSFTNRENSKSSDNANLKIKFKNQILTNITSSLTGSLDRYFVNVHARSGLYFCDLLNNKLYKQNNEGQINLKVNAETSELRMLYDEFFDLIQAGGSDKLALLDDAIKIKGLLA
ncbi:Gfo/Idh/MocA family oxidoreductase [Campylobacter suis]|uniref:Gfo/Idh/MocA-like oxidoreductase N-terminal domain-containing protein n=1 Tax=Campylobacter suis TaxID=2790657 RepID=A0ABN7K1V5_9BACT|nr:Gfo/Idh/MocA family oxidoreductase [Campylobacter suis]CAD7286513.1 hypothetical protein LMG8286_00346 [Campylobacter suis]